MARENAIETNAIEKHVREKSEPRTASEKSDSSSPPERPNHLEVTCPRCESRWTCADPADPTCPDCDASFSVRVRDEFALVERGGWTVAVSLATSDRQGVVDG